MIENTSEPVTTTEETKKELTQEEQLLQMRTLADAKHKMLTSLVGIHIDQFSALMVSNNGVSYAKKLAAAEALKEAVVFALKFGLGDKHNAKIRQGGTNLAKEVNGLAGVLVQALDNRMLILMDEMNKNNNKETGEQTNVVE